MTLHDVTESNNYKLYFLNRKLITEGILRYFCPKRTSEDKLNVCRQTGAGMQFHFIYICLHCFKKGAYAFIVDIGFAILDSDKQLNQQCCLLNFSNFCASFVRKI